MTPYIVAEAGQCYEGSTELAIEMARAARLAGADAIKVQLLRPETIARIDAPKYWTDAFGTTTQRAAFTLAGLVDYGAWREVREACDAIGIEFFATPFDLAAVDALEDIGVRCYKIASGDITYRQLIEACASTGKKLVISTGASFVAEISEAVAWCGRNHPMLLACTLAYPSHAGIAHLGRIERLRQRYVDCTVGYSDHTSLPQTAMCAAAMGAQMLEVHYTYDTKAQNVADHAMALDPEGLKAYVQAAEFGALLRGKDLLAPCEEEAPARLGARRSVCVARDVAEGEVFGEEDLICLRPGDGYPARSLHTFVGTKAEREYRAGDPL